MELEEYKNFEEKENVYKNRFIKTKDDLDNFLSSAKDMRNKSFRGVSESKYKIYSSAQREWITKELYASGIDYKDFIKELAKNTLKLNNGLLNKYLKNIGIPTKTNDFWVLSFLQHYSAPSPMIDLTGNIYKGIFFCFRNMQYTPSDNEINNYVSLYIFDNELISKRFESAIPDLRSSESGTITMQGKRFADSFNLDYLFDIAKQSGHFVVQLKDFSKLLPLEQNNVKFISRFQAPNLNIIAQDGSLLYYLDAKDPLEVSLKSKSDLKGSIECVNIHKSLKEYALERYLKKRKINEDTMFPQEECLASKAYLTFLKHLTK